MAFCPSSVMTSGKIPNLMAVYYARMMAERAKMVEVPLPPVFTVWEVLFFVWIIVAAVVVIVW